MQWLGLMAILCHAVTQVKSPSNTTFLIGLIQVNINRKVFISLRVWCMKREHSKTATTFDAVGVEKERTKVIL